MSVVIAGSVALDNVKTPQDEQKNLLGGSASYAALAASIFSRPVHLVGIIGHDFPQAHLDMLASHGVELGGLERSSGASFTWTGEYHEDMNNRTTHNVAVNVLENWSVKLPAAAQQAKIAIAANMHPENQMQMIDQCGAVDFIAADTMDLWISIANERLHDVLKRIDLLVINDGEAKEFAGTTNLVEAGRKLRAKGPKFVIVKRGEHGSYLFGENAEHFFSCSAYPLPSVFDPTGAGDSFLGGLCGWLSAHGKTKPTFDDLRQAVVHGSVVASYTCEAFSTHKLQTVTALDVAQRIAELKAYTQFA
ncbi:MAG: carbohydrate kinase [Verrucomicrobiaceae bacterium]|nr:carbohydrate kinase [Verrucomicrobiaceae bacterium]